MKDLRTKEELKEFQEHVEKLKIIFEDLDHIIQRFEKVALYHEVIEFKRMFEQIVQSLNLDLGRREAKYVDLLKSGLSRAEQELKEVLKESFEWELDAKGGMALCDQQSRLIEIKKRANQFNPVNFKLR